MIKVALCDDDKQQRDVAIRLLESYAAKRGNIFKFSSFASGDALLNAVSEHGMFDIYILDILMPDKNGIDVGLELRKTDKRGIIVYLTSSPDFALEAYEVRAFHYLLKPLHTDKLTTLMDELVALREKQHTEQLPVKTKDGIVLIPYDRILYAELANRAVRYGLDDRTIVSGMTFSGSFRDVVAPLLDDSRFRLCGASYLINLHYIKTVEKAGVIFTNGIRLAVPKSASSNLRMAWADYWLPYTETNYSYNKRGGIRNDDCITGTCKDDSAYA